MTTGDQEPVIPFGSLMDAFLVDCLASFGLRPRGSGPWPDKERKQLLATAWPPAPLPLGYDHHNALNDFLAYLYAALALATPVSCARCGVSGELQAEILGFLVISIDAARTSRKQRASSIRPCGPG